MTTESSSANSVHEQIWEVNALLDRLPASPEIGHRLDELADYFEDLRSADREQCVSSEEHIWAVWCDHSSPQAKATMVDGIHALSNGDLAAAEAVFDPLVAEFPTWAEAWNKRATLHFLQNRDASSVGDIFRTLELEPRHFGALGGFAQICMRNGAPDAARRALLRLLLINPNAPGIAEAAATLRDDAPSVLH